MSAPHPRSAGRSLPLLAALACALGPAAALGGQAFDPPEVIRLRVPEPMLLDWFPDRVGLTPMPADRFDRLVDEARRGAERLEASRPIEPMRIEHRVRLEGAELSGRTILRFPGTGGTTRWASLWPWSPAVEAVRPASAELVHRDPDGRAFLRLAPAEAQGQDREVEIDWRLRPRAEAEGRTFDLELIEGPATALILDLPEGVTPSGPPGYREGPHETGEAGRRRWRFDGPGGAVVLRLRAAPDPRRPSGPWIGGSTLVELGAAGSGAARWTTSWEIDPGPEGLRPLVVSVPPGVAWEDVAGPEGAVSGVEVRPGPDGTLLTIRWRDGLTGPTRLTLTGLAPVDQPGDWALPSARPLDAQWVGGPVLVRLDPDWSLVDCRERSGRRIDLDEVPPETWQSLARARVEAGGAPAAGEAPISEVTASGARGLALAFFADRPGPAASLHLAPARGLASASVRGIVRIQDGADVLDAEVDIEPPPGSPALLTLELSPGWLPDAVRTADGQPAPRWEQEALPDGRRLVRIHLPRASSSQGAGDARRPELILSAGLIREDPRELALPRLRPIGPVVADERWSVLAGPGVSLRPIEARGLAWIDPSAAAPLAPSPAEPRHLLSWRWIAPDGRGRALREGIPDRPSAVVDQRATIAAGRLAVEWDLRLDPRGEPIRALPFRIRPAPADAGGAAWSLVSADGLAETPAEVAPTPEGEAELRLPDGLEGPVLIRGRLDAPWDGEGPLPMLELPRGVETRGTVSVFVDPGERCETRVDLSFRELDRRPGAASPASERAASVRLAEAFQYDGRPGTMLVRTIPLAESRFDGVILRAQLASSASRGGATRHRLALDVATDGAPTLGVELPEGAELAAVTTASGPVVPFFRDRMLHIPLARAEAEGASLATSGRSRRILIDYERTEPGREAEPARPRFTMPCLSFSWRLEPPDGLVPSAPGPGLLPADPGPGRRGWLPGASTGRLASLTAAQRSMLDPIDERALAEPGGGRRLGEVLAAWDVGRWPLVVDRSALESLGLGPRTILPASPRPEGTPATGAARRALSPLGLLVVPVDTVLLVTSLAEAPRFSPTPLTSGADGEAWAQSLREAVAWGADRADRFRTLERWRATADGGPADPVPGLGGPGVRARPAPRFVAPGWPARGAEVDLVDPWPWLASGAAAGVLLAIAATIRPTSRGRSALRVGLLAGIVLLAAVVAARGGPRAAAAAVGPFYGGLIGLPLALTRGRPRANRDESIASTLIRSRHSASRIAAGSAGSVALIAALVAAQPAPRSGDFGPIIALLPEVAGGDSETVWLREGDVRRLDDLASAPPDGGPPADAPAVGAVRAEHDLAPNDDGSWSLVSRLTLRLESGGPAAWTLPIGRPTELEATFDGRPRPVLIAGSSERATVAIEGEPGHHELIVRQRVRAEEDSAGRRLVVPVNPAATAVLRLADGPGASGASLARSLGPTSIGPDGGLRAAIGPLDRIELRWESSDREAGAASGPAVEGLLLWRALPAADLLDARLTNLGPGPVRELWFAIDPGVAVRSARAAGSLVEGARVVAEDGDRWIARIDPPLPEGGVVQLELRSSDRGPGPVAPEDASPRHPPRLEPLGVSRYEGRIALLRPQTWGGRIESAPDDPPMSDQEFEQDWGPLPRGAGLDAAGAARFEGVPAPSVALAPAPSRRRVEPSVQLDLDAGRWEWRLGARVVDLDGRAVRQVELGLPEDLELIEVEAPGMTAWDRPAPDRLRLRFDGPAASVRPITLAGWLPLVADPMTPGPSAVERPLPWPDWPGAQVEPGSLVLSSPATSVIDYRGADGLPRPLDRLATSNNRRRYRPLRIDRPGTLRVESFPAVTVELWSQLVVGARSARWEALVRYRVAGGPSDRIELILPDAWAERAEYELDGLPPVAVRDLGDRIEIDPGRPIWGAADLRIRSVLPLEPDQPLAFPDLIAWGLGTATAHTIALAVPSDRAPALEYSGLSPADSATRDQFLALFPSPMPPDATRSVYRVQPGGWSLLVQPPAAPGPALDRDEARVDLADVTCVIAPDGTVRGHAAFELRPGAGPFLTLAAPAGAVPAASAVDGRPVRPRLGAEGRWIVPLGDGPARRVELVWIDPPPAPGPRPGRGVAVPQPIHDGAIMLITIRCREADTLSATGGATLPTAAASLIVDRLERGVDRLKTRLEGFAPAAGRSDRDVLFSEVARLLALQRQAERSAYWAAFMNPDAAEVVRQRGPLRRIAAARDSLENAMLAAGLPDLIPSLPPSADPGPAIDVLCPLMPGIPRHFRADTESARPISFNWAPSDSR